MWTSTTSAASRHVFTQRAASSTCNTAPWVTPAAPSERFDGLVRVGIMKGMNNQTATKSNPSLTISKGAYLISVDAKKSRFKTEKQVGVYSNGRFTGSYEPQTITILMTRIVVSLLHGSGDVVTFSFTAMGKKTSMTRSSTLPLAKVVNKTAFGPDMLETGGKPESSTLDKAVATIARMTGLEPTEARRLFNYDLLEAGVVGR